MAEFRYQDEKYVEAFAEKIVGNGLICKPLNKEKLVRLVNIEISRFDMNTMPALVHTSDQISGRNQITIFDADKLDGHAFQDLLAKVLEVNGYEGVNVTGKSGDQGGDVVAALNDQKFVIQVKRYSIDRRVTNKAVQEVMGAIAYYNCDKGIVATNSYFTSSAKELAKINGVILWDRVTISKFIENYNIIRKK